MKLNDQEIIDKANIIITNVPCNGGFFEIPILDTDEPSLMENSGCVSVRYRAEKRSIMHSKENPTSWLIWVFDKIIR